MEDFFQESETVMEEAKKKKTLAEHWATLKGEFKKITWLDRNTVIRQTAAVVAVAVSIGLLIALLDVVIEYALKLVL
jgi:preprotein translocase subunit SecE